MGRALSISSLDLVVSSAFQDHGMNAGKYFALNAAVASEAFDATLFETATNNPLVHTAWHDYHPRFSGSGWCGWGFESNVIASVANAAPTNVLQAAPLFEEGPSGMHTNSIPAALRNQVLAYGIPALSAPVGRIAVSQSIVGDNFDMNVDGKDNETWCRNHGRYGSQWLHSDIQNVGYYYTHLLFDQFIMDGELQ